MKTYSRESTGGIVGAGVWFERGYYSIFPIAIGFLVRPVLTFIFSIGNVKKCTNSKTKIKTNAPKINRNTKIYTWLYPILNNLNTSNDLLKASPMKVLPPFLKKTQPNKFTHWITKNTANTKLVVNNLFTISTEAIKNG